MDDTPFLLLGLAAGALGGSLACINVLFGSFLAIPAKLPGDSRRLRNYRFGFFAFRIVAGAIVGMFATFWLLDYVHDGSLSLSKLSFFQFSAGCCGSLFRSAGMPR